MNRIWEKIKDYLIMAGYLLALIGTILMILIPFIFIITFVFYPYWCEQIISNWVNSFGQGLGL